MSKHHPFQGIGLDKRQQRGYAKKLAHCDRCGQFVDADALIVSEFIPPPREGMEDYIYCAACAQHLPRLVAANLPYLRRAALPRQPGRPTKRTNDE